MRFQRPIYLLVATVVLSTSSVIQAQTSKLFVTYYEFNRMVLMQNKAVASTFPFAEPLGFESTLAVAGDVRTAIWNAGPSNATGRLYSLSGTYLGQQFSATSAVPGHDGTTDGISNFAISATSPTSQFVYAYDRNWQNPTILFPLPNSSGFDAWRGITYDSVDNTLWISGNQQNEIQQFSMAGVSLAGFSTAAANDGLGALALDPADRTLWQVKQAGRFYQWDRNGTLLDRHNEPALFSIFPHGAEFDVLPIPEPGSCALLAIGVICSIGSWRRRRGGTESLLRKSSPLLFAHNCSKH